MMKYRCVYFETSSGRIPVEEFVESLHKRSQQKFFAVVGLLITYGYQLPQPHAKYIGDSIYELRFKGAEGNIRIFYFFFDDKKIVLTNGFIKKGPKAPKREMNLARKRRTLYYERTNG